MPRLVHKLNPKCQSVDNHSSSGSNHKGTYQPCIRNLPLDECIVNTMTQAPTEKKRRITTTSASPQEEAKNGLNTASQKPKHLKSIFHSKKFKTSAECKFSRMNAHSPCVTLPLVGTCTYQNKSPKNCNPPSKNAWMHRVASRSRSFRSIAIKMKRCSKWCCAK